MTGRGWVLIGAAIAAAGGIGYLFYDAPIEARYRDAPRIVSDAPAMVAWRSPAQDTQAFFPGADVPQTDAPQVLSLSRHRAEIQKALGPGTPLAGNALYVYPVHKAGQAQGVVLLRRARGEWGAIEIVAAFKPDDSIAGVRIQRHREPPAVAAYLLSPTFLNAFAGKQATDRFQLGADLPSPPPVVRMSAQAVASAVRALCIEYHAGSRT